MIMDHVKELGLLPYILKVGLFVYDLSQYGELNGEYVKYFGLKPPVRVCVAIPGAELIMYFIAWNTDIGDKHMFDAWHENLHVQSVSNWAAPNIGPYSQVNKFNNVMLIAG